MATARQDIILTAKADFSSVKRATADLANLSRGVSDFLKAGLGIGAGMQIATGAFASLRSGIRETLVEGVKFNASLEQSQLGIAAVLKQFNPQRYRNFQDALKDSAAAIDLLKQKALESPATFESLVGAFQGAAGAMVSAGIPLKKQVDLIVSMSQALAGLGIPEQQILQETRALITGNINANAAAAKILGITGEDISGAKAKGQLYEFLTSKISAFAEAAKLGSQSVNTLESNLKDAKTQVAADATKELTASYKDLLVALTNLVKSEGFKELFEGFANFAKGGVDAARAVSEFAALLASRDPVGTLENRAGELEKAAPEVRSQADVERVRRQAEVQMRVTQKLMSGLTRTVLDSPYGQRLNEVLDRYSAIVETLREKGAAQAQANRLLDEEARKADAVRVADEKAADEREKLLKELPELQKKADALNLAAMASLDRLVALRKNLAGKQDELSNAPTADYFLGSGAASASDEQKKQAQDAATAARLKIQNEIAAITKQIADTEGEITKQKREQADWAAKVSKAYLDQSLDDQEVASKAKLYKLEEDRATLEADFRKTDREKRAENLSLLKQEREELENFVRVLKDQLGAATSDEERQAIKSRLDSAQRDLRGKRREEIGASNTPDPGNFGQNLTAQFTALQNEIGSVAQNAARMFSEPFKTAFASFGDGLRGMILEGKSWKEAWNGLVTSVATSFVNSGIKMFTDWLMELTIAKARELGVFTFFEAQKTTVTAGGAAARSGVRATETGAAIANDATQVASHTTGEATKTAATGAGAVARGVIRVGETIFHGVQVALRVAAHLAAELMMTAITVVQAGLRIASVLAESIAHVILAAVGAMSAMASIPYVGPFLAVAAFAAMLGLGMKLVSSIGKGFRTGGHTGYGSDDEVAGQVHKNEVVWTSTDVRRAGGVAAVEQMRLSGRRPVEAGAGEVAAVESDNKRSLSLVLTTSELEATRIKKNSPAETQIVRIGNKRRHEIRY